MIYNVSIFVDARWMITKNKKKISQTKIDDNIIHRLMLSFFEAIFFPFVK